MSRKLWCLPLVVLLTGCVTQGGEWGGGPGGSGEWPSWKKLGQAAKTAAVAPQTWAPIVGAGLLQIDGVDEKWSEDLATDQPVFGSDAKGISDDLRDVATAAYLITALAAPSGSTRDKFRGLAVGVGTMILDGGFSQGLKDLSSRERPDRSNDQSFPSGHASKASSRTNMAIRNLDQTGLLRWQRQSLTWLLHGVAAGTGIARVEAEKHHLSDVLVGYAVGHFVSTFMYEAFMKGNSAGLQLSFVGVEDGGAFTVKIPLRR